MRKLVLVVAMVCLCWSSGAGATPLDSGNWSQVGYMSAGGGMFNGNCNLAASGCSYGPDAFGDFWSPSPGAFAGQEILFITGDRQYWASGDYASVLGIVAAHSGVFSPNITWSDAGIAGASVGSVTGNILQRLSTEDPWVTIRGPHCAHLTSDAFPVENDCNLMIWGEDDYASPIQLIHNSLKNFSGGVEVYVGVVPEPSTALLLGLGLAGMAARRRV
jgi:hypothetical protein